ncbi:MAG: YIP1 family protein [Deltaproteobacteria bacterium]|nr:YIP1 family protein [Deltaproteobacteria bacterium]MBW2446220.1 YIP1 family protein [Deltaproteobacteria bacterium]
MATIQDRMIRAAKLDTELYEEVEADRDATGQAMAVVALSAVAAGIGLGNGGLLGIVGVTIAALVGWFVWAFLTYVIGTRLLPEPQTKADYGELLRTLGFSSAPGLIRVLGIIPGLGAFVFLVAGVWMLVAMVIAVRQALDYTSTLRAVGVCLIGWSVQAVILVLFTQ